jgi:hypothetical protein
LRSSGDPRPLHITNTLPPVERARSTAFDLIVVMLDVKLLVPTQSAFHLDIIYRVGERQNDRFVDGGTVVLHEELQVSGSRRR